MTAIADAADEFLTCRRIAVTGVSRTPKGHAANNVYRRLRSRGYEVYAVNPHADTVEGDTAYANLDAIPGGVEAVVIASHPRQAMETVQEAARLGIHHVWMHRGPGDGSVDADAARTGRDLGLKVIDGGCPLMFGPTADPVHRFMCRFPKLTRTGVPAQA